MEIDHTTGILILNQLKDLREDFKTEIRELREMIEAQDKKIDQIKSEFANQEKRVDDLHRLKSWVYRASAFIASSAIAIFTVFKDQILDVIARIWHK